MTERFREWLCRRRTKRIVEFCERGVLACQWCGRHMDLADFPALHLARCYQCEMYNFVPQRVDRFWLLEPLGGGTKTRVYKASCRDDPGRLFVVRLPPLNRDHDPAVLELLQHHAEIGEDFGDHPNMVACVGRSYNGQQPFCAMEYVHGKRLDRCVEQYGTLPVKQVCHIALDILEAEQCLYEDGYLYRALKPENVLLKHECHAVLFDYGLCAAKAELDRMQSTMISGSPRYMPPERWLGEPEDARSEIYSLGLVMYYALAGQSFVRSPDLRQVVRRHTSYLRVPVQSKLVGFPHDVVEILSYMIHEHPTERFQSFAEASEAIDKLAHKYERKHNHH